MPKTDRKVSAAASGETPSKEQALSDYRVAFQSRQASLIGRKEVLTGKAKFGIFGDGKEVAQIAMAHSFRKGDWRSGYYRDQTFMLALGATDLRKYFAQLYADPDLGREPASGGRQMNSHFATRFLDDEGQWRNQLMMFNSSADASPTASQMSRLLGLGYASKLYRNIDGLDGENQFSNNGSEIAFGTIGDASTSEGIFWETINAAGVLQVPLLMSVWDDGYGISVPQKYQTTKESISTLLEGFQPEGDKVGITIYRVKAWDYLDCVETYQKAAQVVRDTHQPALIHVQECTQPQGHSTSGSHERYKSKERMAFESSADCLTHLKRFLLDSGFATEESLKTLEKDALEEVRQEQQAAWQEYMAPIEEQKRTVVDLLQGAKLTDPAAKEVAEKAGQELDALPVARRREFHSTLRRTLLRLKDVPTPALKELVALESKFAGEHGNMYNTHLYCEGQRSPLHVLEVKPEFGDKPETAPGLEIIQKCFHYHFDNDPRVFAIGEDVGFLGGVNQGFAGVQEKHGEFRITDTGIREATILGQGIGAAMRGLRPIVDIQYLDYLLYCFQVLSDDLATLRYRTMGGQASPVVIRTRGHRLEGIWHTGSPMGMIIHGARGIHVCVPRNMVQAAGMYATLLQGDDPGLVVEVLNGYRVREKVPQNIGTYTVPLGVPEVLKAGKDVTLVTYGACVRLAQEACKVLEELGVDVELIDAQTLLPFDRFAAVAASVRKTHALVCLDEDVAGGASAYMQQQVLERDGAFSYLDAEPVTIAAKDHRSAYGSDGDYYSKPSVEDIIEGVYSVMRERDPQLFGPLPGRES